MGRPTVPNLVDIGLLGFSGVMCFFKLLFLFIYVHIISCQPTFCQYIDRLVIERVGGSYQDVPLTFARYGCMSNYLFM